jgi:hypothetical protein
MTNPKIKFSHEYIKFPHRIRGRTTYIIGISVSSIADLPECFLKYDTETKCGGYYDLKGLDKVILVSLFTASLWGMVWTTIRRWTPEKEKYYRGLIGQEVEIVVEEAPRA